MGTVSNPATLSSVKAAWASSSNNLGAYVRGGSVVNVGDSSTISTTLAGLKLSQFSGVAAQHTTTYTTSYTTSFSTLVPVSHATTTSWTTSYGTAVPVSHATTTTWTTSYGTAVPVSHSTTTSFTTTVVVCVEEGTPILLPDGTEIPVDDLRVGMAVASMDLPGLEPETRAQEYWRYEASSLEGARSAETRVNHITKEYVEYMVEFWINGTDKPLRVTPSHPLFVYDSRSGVFRFLKADLVDPEWHRFLDSQRNLVLIDDVFVYEGLFIIFKVDCSPLDVFFHRNVLGHNQKPGGNHDSQQPTSNATITSYNSSRTTSNATSIATTTSYNSTRTTSNVTSISTTTSYNSSRVTSLVTSNTTSAVTSG